MTDFLRFGRRINLHTHTYRCKHGSGDIGDYCAAAEQLGIRVLGFSDHAPFPDGSYAATRMHYLDLSAYASEIAAAAATHPGMTLYCGLEGEYNPRFDGYFRDELLGEGKVDYLIGSLHFFWKRGEHVEFSARMDSGELRCIAENSIAVIQSGIYDFMAHPDLFLRHGVEWTPEVAAVSREIILAAVSCGFPLELNGYGWRQPLVADAHGNPGRQYPVRAFWELAAELGGVRAVVNSDAHTPSALWDMVPEAAALARELGLELVNDQVADSIGRRARNHAGSGAPARIG